jgi:hypothetical protein
MHHQDYYLHHVRRRHEEEIARAARHRMLPRRARPPSRWRPLAARGLIRLAERLAPDPEPRPHRRA